MSDDYSYLIDLYTSEGEPAGFDPAAAEPPPAKGVKDFGRKPRSGAPRKGVEIDFLLQGNLPVRAGLWLVQYVGRIARNSGPTALIRLDAEECSVEVYGGRSGEFPPPPALLNRVGEVVHWLAQTVERVVIVPAADEPFESVLQTRERMLLFTGGDDAAVVGAYRLARKLVDTAKELELAMPRAGLVVVGANPQKAQEVSTRIADTAARFMNIELPLEAILQRMDVVESPVRLRIAVGPTFGVTELVEQVRRSSRNASSLDAVDMNVTALDERDEPDEIRDEDIVELGVAREQELPRVDFGEELAASSGSKEQDEVASLPPAPAKHASHSEEPPEEPEAEAPFQAEVDSVLQVVEPEDLAELEEMFDAPGSDQQVDERGMLDPEESPMEPSRDVLLRHFPDLVAVDLPCPIDPRVRIALDESRRVHLLATEEQLRALRSSEAWLCRNESILGAALGGLAPFAEGGIQLDLLVRNAAAASDLQGTGINLYLLLPVPDGTRTVIPLNNEQTARGF